ncbi:MAG: glycosyltransferase family protein [Anaerolineaceae bacterium]
MLADKKSTIAIIQGRMSSSRLPGKILEDIGGEPMLIRVVSRVRRSHYIDQVVVATTDDPSDDPVEALCNSRGIPVYRGSVFDVLDRFYQVALLFNAATVIRVTADCPLIDPGEIDHVIYEFNEQKVDFASNRLPPPWKRTYPIGLDIEVCKFEVLKRAWKEAKDPHQREHVMPYIYEENGRFKVLVIDYPVDYGAMRWTVDTPQDLEVIRLIYKHFSNRDQFSWLEVLDLYARQPELSRMNDNVNHNPFNAVDDRMKEKGQ